MLKSNPQKVVTVELAPEKSGEFSFECSIHENMKGKIVVVEDLSSIRGLLDRQEVAIIVRAAEFIPSRLELVKGLPVVLGATSIDIDHIITVQGSWIEIAARPKEIETTQFTVLQAGEYPDVLVSSTSKDMKITGTIVVLVVLEERIIGFGEKVALQVGAIAPPFELEDLEGEKVSLESLRGTAVLINFWATWCPPCRKEIPDLEAFYEQYKDKGVELLGVNIRESRKMVRNFVNEFGITFPVLLDTKGEVASMYRITAIPTTYFVDKDGIIRAIWRGMMDKDIILANLKKVWP